MNRSTVPLLAFQLRRVGRDQDEAALALRVLGMRQDQLAATVCRVQQMRGGDLQRRFGEVRKGGGHLGQVPVSRQIRERHRQGDAAAGDTQRAHQRRLLLAAGPGSKLRHRLGYGPFGAFGKDGEREGDLLDQRRSEEGARPEYGVE